MIDYYDNDADSQELFEDGFDLLWTEDDPLSLRLRSMTWTHTPAEVRERCWMLIQQRIEAGPTDDDELTAAEPEVNCDRYLYTRRRLQPRSLTAGSRAVAAPVRNFRPRTLAWAFR